MENITVSGMKEINQKLGHIERHLEDISKSFSTLVKIVNRQFPSVQLVSEKKPDPKDIYTPDVIPFPDEEDDDE